MVLDIVLVNFYIKKIDNYIIIKYNYYSYYEY